MQLSEIYLDLGLDAFGGMVRGISIGKLKTYQIYEGFKVRFSLVSASIAKALGRCDGSRPFRNTGIACFAAANCAAVSSAPVRSSAMIRTCVMPSAFCLSL